jgi:mycoredoxin
MAAQFTMYSTPWCGYCHRLKSQLDRAGIEFEVVDIERQPDAAAIVERVNSGNQTGPHAGLPDGPR